MIEFPACWYLCSYCMREHSIMMGIHFIYWEYANKYNIWSCYFCIHLKTFQFHFMWSGFCECMCFAGTNFHAFKPKYHWRNVCFSFICHWRNVSTPGTPWGFQVQFILGWMVTQLVWTFWESIYFFTPFGSYICPYISSTFDEILFTFEEVMAIFVVKNGCIRK